MAKQKTQTSTQKFTEIIDFIGSTVIMNGGKACLIIEITASNFSLLSKKEQDARIYSYASLLNSLSFPIQILIRNKKMDMSSYIKDLEDIVAKTTNSSLSEYIKLYRDFIKEVMTINVVLNKSFYVVIPYSSLEQGAAQFNKQEVKDFAASAYKALEAKANTVLGQLRRFSVTAKILEKDDLVKLFYDLYNENSKLDLNFAKHEMNATFVKGGSGQ